VATIAFASSSKRGEFGAQLAVALDRTVLEGARAVAVDRLERGLPQRGHRDQLECRIAGRERDHRRVLDVPRDLADDPVGLAVALGREHVGLPARVAGALDVGRRGGGANEGSPADLRNHRPERLQAPVDATRRELVDAGHGGQTPRRRQPRTGSQLAAGDRVEEQVDELGGERALVGAIDPGDPFLERHRCHSITDCMILQ
jgi:hypothetical protein